MSQNSGQTPSTPSTDDVPEVTPADVARTAGTSQGLEHEPASETPASDASASASSTSGSSASESKVPPAAAEAAANAAETAQGGSDEDSGDEGSGDEGSEEETPQDATPETGGTYLSEPNAAQQKVADGLRTAGEKVESLAPADGVAKEIADKASAGLKQAGDWVSERDAGAMLTDAKSFVKRKPWAATAIGVGALVLLRTLTGGKGRKR
ncbi:hypothetical protein [Microbacterium sp. JZ31]|uniref:hypothetical protein n=1 Tax=Microbacterium sp. JZ31 TaxID=1906274 RepID=UPI00193372D5|nr:hypothetical protein [Microbacterium sp. JZ31]